MAFDPTKPVAGAEIDANELRDQYNALKALYDAQQAKWDTLAAQLADIGPLNLTVSDPPTMNEVQSIVYQADAILAALKAA